MAAGNQDFKVFLSFKDEATGKFIKATNEQINAVKKVGITVQKEGKAVGINLDKMAQGHEKAGRAARNHNRIVTELQGKIGSLRNIMLLYFFAMRIPLKIFKATTEAAIIQENAMMKLSAAFRATGRGSKEGIDGITELASSLQTLTGYGDEQIISSAALLANYKLTDAQIKKLLPTMLDMTAALKAGGKTVDVEAVAKRLGLAFTGQASYLKRYGITIDETTAKYGSFEEILKAVKSSVDGIAEAMGKTYEGQRNILAASIGDLNEQLGMIVTKSPIVISAMRLIGEQITKFKESIKTARESTKNFVDSWGKAAAAIIGVFGTLGYLVGNFAQGMRAITLAISKIIELGTFLKTGNWDKNLKAFSDDITKNINDAAEGLKNPIKGMVDTYEGLLLEAEKIYKSMVDGMDGIVEKANDNIINTFSATLEMTTTFASNMVTALSDGFFKIVKGDFESLKDVVVSFGDTMLKTILEIISKLMLMSIWKQSAGFLGYTAVATSGHTGGYFMNQDNSFGFRKKFHSGGEVPATLLEGEGVLSRVGMNNLGVDNLNRLNRGEGMSSGQVVNNYYIQTIDERSFRERLQQNGDIYSNAAGRSIIDNQSLRKISQRYG